jgi:hypothetical protein
MLYLMIRYGMISLLVYKVVYFLEYEMTEMRLWVSF